MGVGFKLINGRDGVGTNEFIGQDGGDVFALLSFQTIESGRRLRRAVWKRVAAFDRVAD